MKPSIELKTDLSNSTNNIINDGILPAVKSASKTITSVIDFFNNTILYPVQMYNIYADDKLKKFALQLQEKMEKIELNKVVQPSINIIGPVMEGLKYNLDEEHIKEMFLNILSSDINSDKKELVIPAYIEIIKQISNSDAKFLKTLYDIFLKNQNQSIALLYVKLVTPFEKNSYILLDKYVIPAENRTIRTNQVVLDNLIRLGIIECIEEKAIAGTQLYIKGFDFIKNDYKDIPNIMGTIEPDNGILKITDFGLNFLKVCIEE